MLDHAPTRDPSPVDPVHGFSYPKIIPYVSYFGDLAKGPWTFGKPTRGPEFRSQIPSF
jgi:hypothetical protein